MNSSPPIPQPAGSGAPPAQTPPRFGGLLQVSLVRSIGYGLLGLFALDLAQQLLGYILAEAHDPQADAMLAGQVIEQAGILLVAYALIFFPAGTPPSRASRAAMKCLSWAALLALPIFLGLAFMSATSGVRLYNRASMQLDYQLGQRLTALNQREASYKKIESQLPVMNDQQVRILLADQVPASRANLSTLAGEAAKEQLRAGVAQLLKALPGLRTDATAIATTARTQGRRQQIIYSGKYLFGGIFIALLMLLIFENTHAVRQVRIFEQSNGPSLKFETAVVRGVGRTVERMESLGNFLLPDMDSFRWYRRMKRYFRRDKH